MSPCSTGRLLLLSALALGAGCRGLTLRVLEQNDVGSFGFGGGTDRFYTQGLRLELTGPLESEVPGLSEAARRTRILPLEGDYALEAQYLGAAAGQSIYTPEDISIRTLQVDDRPYAGWLYGAVSWHNLALGRVPASAESGEEDEVDRSPSCRTAPLDTRNDRLDSLELQVGMVGPSSLAEETQTRWHEIIGVATPKGWDNQLQDEVGVGLLFSRKLRSNHTRFRLFRLEHDLITNFGGAVGNVETYFQIGGQARIGHNLRRDFGLGPTVPDLSLRELAERHGLSDAQAETYAAQFGKTWSWYGFIGVDGRFVAHSIFLDGNWRKESHSVEKERFVADFQVGVALQLKHFEISYSQVARTPEFRRTSDPQIFGSLQMAVRF